jgi:hypothetical protein
MNNPTYNTTPVPFDPRDAPEELYAGLTTTQRKRLVTLHQSGGKAYSASGDDPLRSAGLLMVKSGVSFVSPAGCSLAIYAWFQGVTP